MNTEWSTVLVTLTQPCLDGDLLHTYYRYPLQSITKYFIHILIFNMYFKSCNNSMHLSFIMQLPEYFQNCGQNKCEVNGMHNTLSYT
jgi:hypothetical protein